MSVTVCDVSIIVSATICDVSIIISVRVCGGGIVANFYPYTSTVLLDHVSQKQFYEPQRTLSNYQKKTKINSTEILNCGYFI